MAIRSNLDILGVQMQQWEYEISLFADDILMTLTSPLLSLPSLHNQLSFYRALFGYKTNATKTETLPLHIPSDLLI